MKIRYFQTYQPFVSSHDEKIAEIIFLLFSQKRSPLYFKIFFQNRADSISELFYHYFSVDCTNALNLKCSARRSMNVDFKILNMKDYHQKPFSYYPSFLMMYLSLPYFLQLFFLIFLFFYHIY